MTTQPATPQVVPGRYRLDPARTHIHFRIRDLFGLMPVTGSFALEHGTITLADAGPDDVAPAATADLGIAAGSFDTGNRARDRQVRSRRFLDTGKHPSIDVHLDRLECHPDGYRAHGSLTVRGRTAPIVVDLEQVSTTGRETRARAVARIDRYAHGITASRGLASRWVDLTLDITAEHATP